MKTKTIEVYEFKELPEEVQKKVLENLRYVNVEDGYWHDYDGKTGFNSAELKRMGLSPDDPNADELLTWKNLWFDLDYNYRYVQFDQAQFKNGEVARRFLGVPKQLWNQVYWTFENKHYGGASHGTTTLRYEAQDGYKEFTAKQTEILDRAVERFSDKMKEVIKGLESSHEDLTKDESIIETIEANEWTFRANGKMENL